MHVLGRHKRTDNLHSYDTIIIVAGDMKPCTGVNQGRIPTLQDIVRIL
jgi:hypothetical protein